MGIVKMGAYAGAVMAVLVMGQTIVPNFLYPATRGWTQTEFGATVRQTREMYVTDLRRNISYYNKQVCRDLHTEQDLEELNETYTAYFVETGESHPFKSQSQADICRKLRVKYTP